MELDVDYLDVHREAKRARWRVKLTALAVTACIVMLFDLVAQAKPLEVRPVSGLSCVQQAAALTSEIRDPRPTAKHDGPAPAFNFADQTLCSRGR
ncbi:hypothetical protein [Hoeflea sp. TYP-13]|uniref:hypothetical protein n=1 Tax=Hoeflea sp. TYP-13 TaxID=3230023 RepID=UPI0034C66335